MVKFKIPRAATESDYANSITNKNSQKVCIFLSVLMASLFITNSGDIISELVGGGLQQSSISITLKIVCALTFLYCLPVILNHITKVKIIFVFTSVLIVLLNLLLFSNNQITDTIVTFYTMCFTGFMAVDSLQDFSLLKIHFVRTSRIISALAIVFLLLSFTGIITSLRTGGYRMGLGYACITCVMILLWSFAENKKAIDLIGAIGLMALILLYGSRGPIVGISLFAVYFGIRYFHKKGQDIICVLMFIAIMIIVIFYNDIVDMLYNALNGMGIMSRSIYLFANQSLNYDSGRSTIWNVLVNEIQKNPFRIRGINSEYVVTDTYAHNLFIELVYQHGIIIGGIALLYLLARIIDTLKLNVKEDASVICLIFLFAGIPSLMFSGSMWIAQNFWIWLAMIINISRNKRYTMNERLDR